MGLLEYIDNAYPEIGSEIESKKELNDALIEKIVSAANEYKNR